MQELQQQFKVNFPNTYFLNYDKKGLTEFLQKHSFLNEGEYVDKLEKPGEGNMNFVLRAITNQRTFIVKQARPWVEKYPQIPAPINRNLAETAYYNAVSRNSLLESFSPLLLLADKKSYIAIYSDLGSSSDFTNLYAPEQLLSTKQFSKLLAYLNELHALDIEKFPENKAMRELNHEHIFHFPFVQNNGFDLDNVQPGLEKIALAYKTNAVLKEKITYLGSLYLGEGNCLIHGDFYPGSWLANNTGIKVIDPEFSFLGYAEFDIAVLIAHLFMAKQPFSTIQYAFDHYQKDFSFDYKLVAVFAGTEVLRRILGVAQLPLPYGIEEKEEMLKKAADWILQEEIKF